MEEWPEDDVFELEREEEEEEEAEEEEDEEEREFERYFERAIKTGNYEIQPREGD